MAHAANKTIKRTFSDKRSLVFSSKMSLSCEWKKNELVDNLQQRQRIQQRRWTKDPTRCCLWLNFTQWTETRSNLASPAVTFSCASSATSTNRARPHEQHAWFLLPACERKLGGRLHMKGVPSRITKQTFFKSCPSLRWKPRAAFNLTFSL